MNLAQYGFAFFVFILCVALIYLVHIFKRSRSKTEDIIKDKEKRLYLLYQNIEDLINGTEEYIEEAKSEIAEQKNQLADKHKQVKLLYEQIQRELNRGVLHNDTQIENIKENANTPGNGKNYTLQEKVMVLWQDGMSQAKIARELSISTGEVALILGIKKDGS